MKLPTKIPKQVAEIRRAGDTTQADLIKSNKLDFWFENALGL
ncbi:MAG TPA: hypothetical protein VIS99_10455 [Terrimicrobiaceae bacterium]|jgi:hypothetical protein